MPINKEYNLTFIHIPKNGGNTVATILGMRQQTLWLDQGPLSLGRYEVIDGVEFAPQHYTWDILKEKLMEPFDYNGVQHNIPDFYENSIKFAFVRNPYERILSEYFWLHGVHTEYSLIPFKEWLTAYLEKIDNDHKIPQYKFIPEDIDFLCRFENFNEDFRKVLIHIDHTLIVEAKKGGQEIMDVHIPKINQSNGDKSLIVKDLDEECKQIIYNIYKKDFELFNYEK